MLLRYYIVDVFTKTQFGGNPLAVVLDADELNETQMQAIAREFNLSETTFLQTASNEDAIVKFRIFTPLRELPIAGHPIIGSCEVLLREGLIPIENPSRIDFQVEVAVGNVPIRIDNQADNERFIYFSAPIMPEFDSMVPTVDKLSALLNLECDDIVAERILRVYHGNWTLVIPIATKAALAAINVDYANWNQLLGDFADEQIYPVFFHDDPLDDIDATVRLFYFGSGIGEDPATGSAAISLAAYLAHYDRQFDASYSWTISQGETLSRPSIIKAQAVKENGQIAAIRIGGNCVLVAKGELNLD